VCVVSLTCTITFISFIITVLSMIPFFLHFYKAARRAGMHVIWIPDERMDEALFSHDPGVTRIKSMEAFQPELFGLPPF
jgi:hypothetical protein